jgi:hypothetical protein
MQGTGYIYHWRTNDGVGRIRVCTGSFTNLNVPFSVEDCDAALRKVLKDGNISRPRECPPPADALRVRFSLEVRNGALTATNIS